MSQRTDLKYSQQQYILNLRYMLQFQVRDTSGTEAVLPALIFVIPSPDSTAVAHADR